MRVKKCPYCGVQNEYLLKAKGCYARPDNFFIRVYYYIRYIITNKSKRDR